jgi:Domain of unknown function (DUF4159)
MTPRRLLAALAFVLVLAGTVCARNRWWQYEREMQDPVNDPPDADKDAEFTFARLRYRSPRDRGFRRARWGTDANKSERQFIIALRRLSRVNGKSIEQIVDIDSDEMFDYPFLYAVAAGDWAVSPAQGARLREFFERGGFLVTDDFHNDREWAGFMDGVHMALPDRDADDIPNDDAIFHVVHDLSRRVQISGYNIVYGQPNERGGTDGPHWRAVRDAKGRIAVAAWHNQDLGDAWEWADAPEYPERLASEAFRIGVNYVVYTMTH